MQKPPLFAKRTKTQKHPPKHPLTPLTPTNQTSVKTSTKQPQNAAETKTSPVIAALPENPKRNPLPAPMPNRDQNLIAAESALMPRLCLGRRSQPRREATSRLGRGSGPREVSSEARLGTNSKPDRGGRVGKRKSSLIRGRKGRESLVLTVVGEISVKERYGREC